MKRAQLTTLQFIIIALVAGLVLLVGTVAMAKTIGKVFDAKNCESSIARADALGKLKKIKDIVPSLECKAANTEIKISDVSRSGSNNIVDKLMKLEIAQKMKHCWEMTGSGRHNPFRGGADTQDESFCIRCEELTFSDSLIKQAQAQGYRLTNLDYFFMTRPLNRAPELYTLVTGQLANNDAIQWAAKDDTGEAIDLSLKYTILWRLERDDQFGWWGIAEADTTRHLVDLVRIDGQRPAIGLGTVEKETQKGAKDEAIIKQVWLVPKTSRNSIITFPLADGGTEDKAMCSGVVN